MNNPRASFCHFQLSEASILPFARTEHHLTSGQQEENRTFLNMIQEVLSTPDFFFSYTTDLTNSLQRKHREGLADVDLNEAVTRMFYSWDERFVWNRRMLARFLALGSEFLRYCVPLLHGAVFIRRCSINGTVQSQCTS